MGPLRQAGCHSFTMRCGRTLNLRCLGNLSRRQALGSDQPPQVGKGHDRRLLVSRRARPGLRRHQQPEHLYIEVTRRRIGIAIDLPARAGQPVSVRLAPLADRLMSVADRGDRARVSRGSDEPARKR
jgi:hypothetical protein